VVVNARDSSLMEFKLVQGGVYRRQSYSSPAERAPSFFLYQIGLSSLATKRIHTKAYKYKPNRRGKRNFPFF